MSSAVPSSTLRLIAALTDGRAPAGAGEVRRRVELGDRRATRSQASAPSRMDLLAVAQEHEANVAAYVARHGVPMEPSGRDRSDLYERAGAIAAAGGAAAAAELEAIDLADWMLAALSDVRTADRGKRAVTAVPCPQCQCWSLLAVPAPRGGWMAACRQVRCGSARGPRTWSLLAVARHQVRETRAA